MAVTAYFAVLLAAGLVDVKYDSALINPKFLVSTAVEFAGVGVCLYNLRYSGGCGWCSPVI